MSTDAFTAAVCRGTTMRTPKFNDALRVGAIFGIVETLTPLLGWLVGHKASQAFKAIDHWIAFILLCGLGIQMIHNAWRRKTSCAAHQPPTATQRPVWGLLLTSLATSLDAMALGITLAFLEVPIYLLSLLIGSCTFISVTTGIILGNAIGSVAGRVAEVIGGLLLVGLGSSILYQHVVG